MAGHLHLRVRSAEGGGRRAAAGEAEGEAEEAGAEEARQVGVAAPNASTCNSAAQAISSAELAASHSSSACAIAATTLARVFDSSAARAGSVAYRLPSPSVASSLPSCRVNCAILSSRLLHALAQRRGLGPLLRRRAAHVAAIDLRRRLGDAGLFAREHQAPVVVEIAVERRDRAVGDQPQPVGAGLEQMAVVDDQDHRARDSR